eukprot:4723604-Amphidinium_carterae.1
MSVRTVCVSCVSIGGCGCWSWLAGPGEAPRSSSPEWREQFFAPQVSSQRRASQHNPNTNYYINREAKKHGN